MQKLGRPQNLIIAKKTQFWVCTKNNTRIFSSSFFFYISVLILNIWTFRYISVSNIVLIQATAIMRLTAKINKNKIQNLIPEKHTFWVGELRNLIPTKISTVKVVTNSFFFFFSIDHIESLVLYYFVFLILKQILFCDR